MSVVAGLLFGSSFIPVIYIQNKYKGSSQDGRCMCELVYSYKLLQVMINLILDKHLYDNR